MGRYTVIPQDSFDELQLDAGVLLNTFNPASPQAPLDSHIICATTGGINVSCVPTYSDLGEDVDNCPNNMMEYKHLDGWECKLGFTSLGTSLDNIKLALGAATKTAASKKVVPNKDLSQSDFADIWWVGDTADGGAVAVKLKNALSTGGFSLQTTKNGKGQTSCELTGHVSVSSQSTMPMEFYVLEPANVTYTQATLSGGFVYGVKYFTRTGAGTTESPYVYTEVPANEAYSSSKTYYTRSYS